MGDDIVKEYENTLYRLRCGPPMPVGCVEHDFVLHTFMVESTVVEVFLCTDTLPSSSDFRGRGGNYISANFSRLKSEGGGDLFEGTMNNAPTYIYKEDIPY